MGDLASNEPVPIILVTGATGSQGGGVVRHLLKGGGFKVRGLTRDATSVKARALVERGVDVVQGDLLQPDSLTKAFAGASTLFLVTDYWGSRDADVEIKMGKNAIDAAKAAGIDFVLFSSLEDPGPIAGGKMEEAVPGRIMPQFESKAEIEAHLRQSGLPFATLLTCMFYDDFVNFPFLQPQADGTFVFYSNCGPAPHPWHCADDVGGCSAVIFREQDKFNGRTIPVVGEHISCSDLAKTVSEVTGKTVRHQELPDAIARGAYGADLANIYVFLRDFPFHDESRSVSAAHAIYKGPTFRQWAEQNREALLRVMSQSSPV
ncbi:hypothetical protein KFL_000220470 [Klebsormidium nitens]|uniref:NmrA-like domain-containing protein n=1 Tax=Klebsormidium nitens TaxID=105231 RepID=A0A1Y1HLZ8_KLENI|nr:hypothetical protein KFL_000220470 [Klebsormidium nitens]|eukprot:GAQ79013.1 hypothetical protein KFL_000220470 [Klebsormidium nitens]